MAIALNTYHGHQSHQQAFIIVILVRPPRIQNNFPCSTAYSPLCIVIFVAEISFDKALLLLGFVHDVVKKFPDSEYCCYWFRHLSRKDFVFIHLSGDIIPVKNLVVVVWFFAGRR